MADPLLDIDIRRKTHGPGVVLEDVQARIFPGERVALVGASGCGKSSLLRLVSGLDRAYEGRILLAGQPVQGLSREVGILFQRPRLFPWLTVAENVAFDLGRSLRSQPATRARITALLAEVGMSELAQALPRQLSAGQAQRVAIARCLFSRPRLLLLDEPFSAVDTLTRLQLQDLLLTVAAHHQTSLLLVTDDIAEAAYLADRVWVLHSQPGRLASEVVVPLPHPRQRDSAALAERHAKVLQALQAVHAA